MHTFESVLAALAREGIRFLVVGGLAVVQAGYVRLTEDLDLLVQADRDNLAALLRVLAGVGSGAAAELTVDDLALEEGAVRIAEDFDIDLFTLISGHRYESLELYAEPHPVLGATVHFLGPQGLLLLKQPSLPSKTSLTCRRCATFSPADRTLPDPSSS